MAVEAPTSYNSTAQAEEPPRCAHPRCKCRVAKQGEYCPDSSCAGDQSKTTKYCPCEHGGCYHECDLVMKGGITSGIVYPPLVYKLHEDNYRFRYIGGTSAGAIAAAVAAAAEYGRESGGFEKLEEVKKKLGTGTFLRDLFQPSKETRPLYNLLLGSTETVKGKKRLQRLRAPLQRLGPGSFLLLTLMALIGMGVGALLGFGLASLFGWLGGGYWWVIVVLPLAIIGAVVGELIALLISLYRQFKILTRKVPSNFFGICTGLKDDSMPQDKEVLTNWLNDRINDLAGITDPKKPLTFGMLKKKKFARQREGDDGIKLLMVTCNLSQNQPYVLPFKDHLLIGTKRDFEKFFPTDVVTYLMNNAAKREAYEFSPELKDKYFFLPEPDDLPVVVATRLSLSFPLLLCALPLYTIIPNKVEEAKQAQTVELSRSDLKLNWFSDGGIASNFPIQFFDGGLPTRPTFGVNLVSLPEESFEEESFIDETFGIERNKKLKREVNSPIANPVSSNMMEVTGYGVESQTSDDTICNAIYLPKADAPLYTEWVPMTKKSKRSGKVSRSLFKFLWSIFTTAQNYRDNMQAMLPSYRERIVQIRLSDEEGGLNLAMAEQTINDVMEKGRSAGELLTDFDFEVHKWVRFQILMSQMETYLKDMWKVARIDPATQARLFDYLNLMKAQAENTYPYQRKQDWCENAEARMRAMGVFIEGWGESKLSDDPPRPESFLRVTPEL